MKNYFFVLLIACSGGYAQQTSGIDTLRLAFNHSTKPTDKVTKALEISRAYKRMQLDSSFKYLEIAKKYSEEGNKELQAQILLNIAALFRLKNKYEPSLAANQKALKLFKEVGDYSGMGYANTQIGDTYFRMSSAQNSEQQAKKALEYCLEAIGNFKMVKDTVGYIGSYRTAGKTYRDLGDYRNAEVFYLRGLKLAEKANIENSEVGMLNANISQIRMEVYQDYDGAIKLLHKAIAIYKRTGNYFSMEHANRNLAENYRLKGNFPVALDYANKAVALAEELKDDHYKANSYDILFRIQTDMGDYKEALNSFREVKMAEESAINMAISDRIAEMEAKYETERKDAEIAVLNAREELSRLQKVALWFGIIMLMVIASLIILNIRQKRKRELADAASEIAIEKEKRQNIQKELEFKQKELTSKILQLARKNEFLNTLELEVETMKTNVDGSVNKASTQISRLIKRDASDNKQWEQFSAEFGSLHQGFLDALIAKHGSFTKSEIRLISLMKMNLSSKDIADTLNISPDGIKKARYRLRKKLNLEDSGLQSYLLNLS
jgi:tetratricopeptide (TPR) repeat protein